MRIFIIVKYIIKIMVEDVFLKSRKYLSKKERFGRVFSYVNICIDFSFQLIKSRDYR